LLSSNFKSAKFGEFNRDHAWTQLIERIRCGLTTKGELTKVTAYITREKEGRVQLLTMLEEGVESFGLQVPGGTLQLGEELEECLLREIYEEAKLSNVEVNAYLGEHTYYFENKNADITRHYFHLTIEECGDEFTVVVCSQDEDNGWIYHYRWLNLESGTIPTLGGYLGVGLINLFKRLF
jgi:8-oxo-dGTP pyrophosphatase MutT (NUDIX family)